MNSSIENVRSKVQVLIDAWGAHELDPMGETLEWARFRNFAVDTLLLEHDLSTDEFLDMCAVDGTRDKGIDAIWLDEGGAPAVLHLFQCKDQKPQRGDWSKMAAGLLDLFDPSRPQAMNRFLREWSAAFSDNHPAEFSVVCHLAGAEAAPDTLRKANGHSENRGLLGKDRTFIYEVHDIYDLNERLNATIRRTVPIDATVLVTNDEAFEYSEGPARKMVVALVPARFLANQFELHGKELFRLNPRYFLSLRSPNNREISTSLLEDPERFHLLNNGITSTSSGVAINRGPAVRFEGDNPPVSELTMRDFQIVNGCQTTAVIHRISKEGPKGKNAVNNARVLMRVIEDPTPDYYETISVASNTQTPLKHSDWRSFEKVHDRLRREFDALPERWFYEYWRGTWDTDYADSRSRLPYLKKGTSGKQRTYRKLTSTDLAQHGWAFLGAGYRSAEEPRRVMEDDETWQRVFPEATLHCSQLLLAYLIGRSANEVLQDEAEAIGQKKGHYSALKFPIVATIARILRILHESQEGEYLSVSLSQQLIRDIDSWCLR